MPASVLAVPLTELRAAGLSTRKVHKHLKRTSTLVLKSNPLHLIKMSTVLSMVCFASVRMQKKQK